MGGGTGSLQKPAVQGILPAPQKLSPQGWRVGGCRTHTLSYREHALTVGNRMVARGGHRPLWRAPIPQKQTIRPCPFWTPMPDCAGGSQAERIEAKLMRLIPPGSHGMLRGCGKARCKSACSWLASTTLMQCELDTANWDCALMPAAPKPTPSPPAPTSAGASPSPSCAS